MTDAHVQVVRGTPDDMELAALVAGLMAAASERARLAGGLRPGRRGTLGRPPAHHARRPGRPATGPGRVALEPARLTRENACYRPVAAE